MLDRLQSFTVADPPTSEPRVVSIDGESATALLKAISSQTAREILAVLHRDPQPPSRIASKVDTSLANVNYHLDNLQSAGLVQAVDTWYSEKGREMTVYAPTHDPLVFAGSESRATSVRTLLGRVGVALAVLGLSSWLVQWFVTDHLVSAQRVETIRKATAAGTIEGVNLTPLPPGLLFFTGGTFVLALVVLGWYLTVGRRPGPDHG